MTDEQKPVSNTTPPQTETPSPVPETKSYGTQIIRESEDEPTATQLIKEIEGIRLVE